MDYTVSEWNGFERRDFKYKDHDALVVLPKTSNSRWMMKMEYFGAFPNLEIELLRRGWTLAYIKNDSRWGVDSDSHRKARFADYLSGKFSLEKRFTCVGMSCGGICSVNFASRHPDYVGCLYLDAPVMNMLSCPMGFGVGNPLSADSSTWQEIVNSYGFDRSSLLSYREHPIDRLPILAEHKLPAAIIYGDSDQIVPYVENGAIMEKYWREAGLPLFVVGKKDCGHHPHGLEDPTLLADFIEANALR
ncbi:MAG: hypothetical protein GX628_00765 [Clostridiales bacterium]|nr:hypothetical protein [Clostridiales bacterium]